MTIDQLWAELSYYERRELLALAAYQAAYERTQAIRRGKPQRVARGLLSTLLSPTERRQAAIAHRGIDVVGPETGLLYRLHPNAGVTNLMSPSGNGAHYEGTFCLHGDEELPPADITIAHLLWIRTDEMGFLEAANFHPAYNATVGQGGARAYVCQVDERFQ